MCLRMVWLTCATSSRSLKEKALFILQATFQHARNLAFFTAVYRTLMAVLDWSEGRASRWHTFVAAFTSGYFVFGREDKVNTQVRPEAELPAGGGVNFTPQLEVSHLSMHFSHHSSLNENCAHPSPYTAIPTPLTP